MCSRETIFNGCVNKTTPPDEKFFLCTSILIDLHSHIIYGVDDGSVDRDMSKSMMKLAAESGTTDIFCTPHCIDLNNRPSWELIKERAVELQSMVDTEAIALKVHTGAEMMLGWDMLECYKESKRAYCLGDSSYALVELPMHELPLCADDFWYQMQLMGLAPVLAHPERYSAVDMDILLKWAKRGVLLQINGGSLLGKFGPMAKERAELLLYNGMVSFMGSDAHRVEIRNTDLSEAYVRLVELVGSEKAEEITVGNPRALLADRLIEPELPDRIHHMHGEHNGHKGLDGQDDDGRKKAGKAKAKKKGFFARLFG